MREAAKALRLSVWARTKIKSLKKRFCRDFKICRDLHTFWKTLDKKRFFFLTKAVFLGQEVHYFMVYIAYYIILDLEICNYAQKK